MIADIIGHLGIDASMSNTNAGNVQGAFIRDSISVFGQSRSPLRMSVVIIFFHFVNKVRRWIWRPLPNNALGDRLTMTLFVRWEVGVAQSTHDGTGDDGVADATC